MAEPDVAAFLRAVASGDVRALERAVAKNPDIVNATGPHPYWGGEPQPLHVALDMNRQEMVKWLLAHGADVNGSKEGYDGWSPLLVATIKGRFRARDMLLRRGARIGLGEALLLGRDSAVKRLLSRNAHRATPPSGGSWLRFARTPWAVRRLLALGVSGTQTDRWGVTPADGLSQLGARGKPLLQLLQHHGVPIPPDVLARVNDRPALARALERDPTLLSNPGVLVAAVQAGRHHLTAWWLGRGASPNGRSAAGSRGTALHDAAWRGDWRMVELLLRHGADPLARDAEHNATPADWARTAVKVTGNPQCAVVARRLTRAAAKAGARKASRT